MWEILNDGSLPYPELQLLEVLIKVTKAGLHPDTSKAPHFYSLLMTACFNRIPSQRPTFSQISTYLSNSAPYAGGGGGGATDESSFTPEPEPPVMLSQLEIQQQLQRQLQQAQFQVQQMQGSPGPTAVPSRLFPGFTPQSFTPTPHNFSRPPPPPAPTTDNSRFAEMVAALSRVNQSALRQYEQMRWSAPPQTLFAQDMVPGDSIHLTRVQEIKREIEEHHRAIDRLNEQLEFELYQETVRTKRKAFIEDIMVEGENFQKRLQESKRRRSMSNPPRKTD